MKDVLRKPTVGLVALALAVSLMAAVKFLLGGKIELGCYLVLVEYCTQTCWVGRPVQAYPWQCRGADEIVSLVFINIGIFLACLCVASGLLVAILVCCCGCELGCSRQDEALNYARLMEEETDPQMDSYAAPLKVITSASELYSSNDNSNSESEISPE